MFKKISGVLAALSIALIPGIASAHVIVTPGQTGVGEELTFNVSVPNEKEVAVTNLKLDIPEGVTDVTPTSKDGWTITTEKSSGSDAEVTSITWADGTIPVGQRQDFSFSAQAPAKATDLDWKAYQTYADGLVVHWDQKPAGSDDATGDAGPYSVTKVVNDLTDSASTTTSSSKTNLTGPYVLAGLALVVAVAGFVTKRK